MQELLFYGEKNPKEQLNYPIVALGTVIGLCGLGRVGYLHSRNSRRDVFLGHFDHTHSVSVSVSRSSHLLVLVSCAVWQSQTALFLWYYLRNPSEISVYDGEKLKKVFISQGGTFFLSLIFDI